MTPGEIPRTTREFVDRADALAEFLRAAGHAPRLLPADDGVGCPLFHALAALQWSGETGLVQPSDRLHAVWFAGDTAAAVIEREQGGKQVFRYFGPRVETLQRPPVDGEQVLDEMFVRGYEFTERWNAVAHFLVTTQGSGALIAFLSSRAPEVEHVRRWLLELFQGPVPEGADYLHAAWLSAAGAGFLFPPASFANDRHRGWTYVEIGLPRDR
ncbi:MAG: hypothetical protein HY705_02365 [Gemmatimonadetes bacterium]|nr:hypothetical protein [Gemmatimonadota bacterium]